MFSAWKVSLNPDSPKFFARHPPSLIAIVTLILVVAGLWTCSKVAGISSIPSQSSAGYVISATGLACLTGGFFVGFLFGIPRVLQGDSKEDGEGRSYEQRVNTNLEQISDWLTKILVGVGLVELKAAPAFIWSVSHRLSQSYSTHGEPNSMVAPAICSAIAYFSILGLLAGYLLTRLYFASVFAQADQNALVHSVAPMPPSPSTDLTMKAAPSSTPLPSTLSPASLKILNTLAIYQEQYFSKDRTKRWTFGITPHAPDHANFRLGLEPLLNAGLVTMSSKSQVLLTDLGLDFVSKHKDELGVEKYGPFSPSE